MDNFLRITFSSMQLASAVAFAALGIVLIFRTSKTTNFAQGSIGTFNAYVAATLMLSYDMGIWAAAGVAMITAFITGILIDKLIIRPASRVSPVAKQIITLGLIMVFLGALPFLFGTDTFRLPRFIPIGHMLVGNAVLRHNTIFIVSVAIGVMGVIFWFIQRTKWGLAIRVTASNNTTSRLMGVPTGTVTMIAWAVAAMLATAAAIIIAPQSSVNPGLMYTVQIYAFFAGVLGGFQTFYGAVIGSYLIVFAINGIDFYVSDVWANVIVYTSILIFLYIKPYGLFGKKPVRKV